MKKRFIVIATVIVVAGVGGLMVLGWLFDTINTSQLSRSLADVRSVATVLQKYCHDHGTYPVTFDFQAFRQSVMPNYCRDIELSMSYYSDGTNYAFVLRPKPFADATPRQSPGIIEVHNGRILWWPAGVDEEEVRLLEQRLMDMHSNCVKTTPGQEVTDREHR